MPVSLPFFDYEVPDELKEKIKIGQLIRIPFLKSEQFGVVADIKSSSAKENLKLKPINNIVFEEPALSKEQVDFLRDIAEFYHTSLGFILKTNLPPLQKTKLKKMVLNAVPKSRGKFEKPEFFLYKDESEKQKFILEKITADESAQVLYLVPELPHINKIKNILPKEIFDNAVIITSELSNKEIFAKWMQIRTGEKKLVIGTRRALFLPWFNLKTIILDDEANANYKSWDMAPRIQTRDAVLFLAKHHCSQLYLLSHTPSVETHYFAKQGIYSKTGEKEIHIFKNFPDVIDLKQERKSGNYSFMSADLVNEFKQVKSGDIFFFLNRRGSASYVGCRDCGNVNKCPNCHFALNYHQDTNVLKCHYCGYTEPMVTTCKVCHGVNMAILGVGTQLAETNIRRLLGSNNTRTVIRIDSDENDLEKLKIPGDKIIIGTQMAWPHIDWSRIKLLVFLDADTSLFIPEYKIAENLWQMLRDAQYNLPNDAKFIIQTNHPDHLVFRSLFKPEIFYQEQMKERKVLGYPPYKFLLKLFLGSPKMDIAEKEASRISAKLLGLTKGKNDIIILGPLEMAPYFYNGQYWQVILAKINYETYKQSTKLLLSNLPNNWKADPNPNSILYFS